MTAHVAHLDREASRDTARAYVFGVVAAMERPTHYALHLVLATLRQGWIGHEASELEGLKAILHAARRNLHGPEQAKTAGVVKHLGRVVQRLEQQGNGTLTAREREEIKLAGRQWGPPAASKEPQ